ncbi:SDR family NAD(P)-dependent oxidoreductase [Nocardioides humi]|uniref:3-oxoacyl-ACP reductase FabG n=1 Tax=Nocardioides humi TaxID=449461 RepID=A0ABN2AB11_9ACTN|nr:SDR family oxidoreductase [Nocardioides humi]
MGAGGSRDGGRTVIVTGASQGLGRTIACALAPTSRALLVVDRLDEPLQLLAAQLRRAGHQVAACVADLTEDGSAGRVVAVADVELGGADALVNNAGLVEYAAFFDTSPELLRRLLRVDVESVFLLTQAFAASVRDRGESGAVVNLGTSHALAGVAGTSAYAAAKGAVHALTRALAVELAGIGIRVNTLALGTTLTERVRTELPPALLEQRLRQIPLHRGADPAEAARAVSFLLDAEFATGTELVLDGGFTVYGDG